MKMKTTKSVEPEKECSICNLEKGMVPYMEEFFKANCSTLVEMILSTTTPNNHTNHPKYKPVLPLYSAILLDHTNLTQETQE